MFTVLPKFYVLTDQSHYNQVVLGTANFSLSHSAGCCHLTNLPALSRKYYPFVSFTALTIFEQRY